ncbi:MAG: diaminopimelate epimerase [Acidobacteriota bacterium]|nr:diaminopimelate epimerase [Acidobacteriota bacterium]
MIKSRPARVPFAKLHGLGNDFIVTGVGGWDPRDRKLAFGKSKEASALFLRRLATEICDRHTGVGADGLLLLAPPLTSSNDAEVRFFNSDGGEAEMSGNGIRCAGAFLMEAGGYESPLRIETKAGVKTLDVVGAGGGSWTFRVAMGNPILEPGMIPFKARNISAPVIGYELELRGGRQKGTITSMGNPHCSILVESFDDLNWCELGREIESHPLFPNRTNVEFIKVASRDKIEVRFWERGAGATASSGTGSCAAAVASFLNGYTARKVQVMTMGGSLSVEWPEGGEIFLTGPAQWIAEGVYSCWSKRAK